MRRCWLKVCVYVVFCNAVLCFIAQNTYAQSRQYEIGNITTAESLPSPFVMDIHQSRDGFIWLATWGGLARYDGVEIETYRPIYGDTASIGGVQLFAVTEDSEGGIWVGGGRYTPWGVSRLNRQTGQFKHFKHIPENVNSLSSNAVLSLYVDSISRSMWVGTLDGGLDRIDLDTHSISHNRHQASDDQSISDDQVHAMYRDRNGALWIGSWGLNKLESSVEPVGSRTSATRFSHYYPEPEYEHSPPDLIPESFGNRIQVIYEDKDSVLWLGTRAGLYRFDRQTTSFDRFLILDSLPSSQENNIYSLFEDKYGNFWVGTSTALHLFDDVKGDFTEFKLGTSGVGVYKGVQDRFGVLWFGVHGEGLVKMIPRDQPFHVYYHDPRDSLSIASNAIAGILEDTEGDIWVGAYDNAGLSRIDSESGETIRYYHDPSDPATLGSNTVLSLYEDDEGLIWIGTSGEGLDVFDKKSNRFTHYKSDVDNPSALRGGVINQIMEDSRGRFWIVAWDGGLNLLDRKRNVFTHFGHTPGDSTSLLTDHVTSIYEDREGSIWIGSASGISRYDALNDTFDNFPTHGLTVLMMCEDQEGQFWIATLGDGIHLFDRSTGEYTSVGAQHGLAHNNVKSIFVDGKGFLWVGTDNGLSRYDTKSGLFRNYSVADGLPHASFNEHAHFQSREGVLYLGTPNGLVTFDPNDIVVNPEPPAVYTTRVQLETDSSVVNLYASTELRLRLPHNQNTLNFYFVGIYTPDPGGLSWEYKLENNDTAWRKDRNVQFARYSRLVPGDYVFRVRAQNPDGIWSEESKTSITILSPWWRTSWAFSLYALFLGIAIFAVNRLQRARLIAREREDARIREAELLAEAADERMQLLEHIDGMKSRFFVNLSHEFRTPLTLLLGPIRDAIAGAYGNLDPRLRDQLGPMHRAADRLHRLINQLLDLARLEAGGMRLEARAGDLVAFVRALTLSFASRAEREQKTLLLETATEALEVYFDRDKLEKIVYNLLSNAFKFTASGGKIRVSVEASDGSARIVVRDTGEGIPAAELPHIFDRFHQADASPTRRHEGSGIGLALAKELAELHHGAIKVESEEGFGSTFTLTLPLGRTHLKDEELIADDDSAPLVDRLDRLDQSDATPSAESSLSTLSNPATLATATILLVEDNADVRAYLKSHLLAYRILEAEDGEAGLALALSALPDLVISDVMMPKLDGFGLCSALRRDKRTQDIPVLLLTAKAAEENKIEGLKMGADDYLYKPFSARELLARTENLIHRNQKLKEQYRQEVVLKPTEITVTSADAAFLEKVRTVVESGMGDSQFGVEQLAEEVGLGRRQLQRKMHELTRQTVHRYIQEIRLDRARQLIEQKAGNVSEVAYQAGFRDPRHFARLFQQKYGKPPSQWG